MKKIKEINTQWWIDNAVKWHENEMNQVALGDIFTAIREVKNLKPKSILDVGCGTGRWAPLMPDVDYLGVDVSPYLIQVAKKNNPDKKFAIKDLNNLSGLKKFDLFFSYATLLGISPENIKKVCKELKKICKYGVLLEKTIAEEFNPYQVINSNRYIHNYRKLFNVIKEIPLETTRSLFVVKL